jgi:hypothetical protein
MAMTTVNKSKVADMAKANLEGNDVMFSSDKET